MLRNVLIILCKTCRSAYWERLETNAIPGTEDLRRRDGNRETTMKNHLRITLTCMAAGLAIAICTFGEEPKVAQAADHKAIPMPAEQPGYRSGLGISFTNEPPPEVTPGHYPTQPPGCGQNQCGDQCNPENCGACGRCGDGICNSRFENNDPGSIYYCPEDCLCGPGTVMMPDGHCSTPTATPTATAFVS